LPIGHRLESKSSVSPRDLVDELWVGVPDGFPYDRILAQIEVINASPARIGQRFLDNGIVEAIVAAGHGIAVLPRYTTRDRENGLITRPLSGVRAVRTISALMRPDRAERPSVRLVVEALRTEAARFQAEHDNATA
jgi:DNA-binding transcriptional LysR family regulator